MPDYSDLMAGNPYFAPQPRNNLNTLGAMLANMGAGIAQGGQNGQPWFAGIGPGAAMASNSLARQKEQDDLEEARRFQMGLHLQQLKQLQEDRDTKNAGIAAWVKGNTPTDAPPVGGVPGGGMNVQPNPVQMGPRAPAPATGPQGAAISKIEGDYSSVGPAADAKGSRGYGKYQVMDYNIGPWTKQYLGKEMTPQEFIAPGNEKAQDAVFNGEFGRLQQKYGPVGAAQAWFGGEKGMNNPNAKDVNGMTVARYGQQFAANGGAPGAAPGGAGPTFASLPPFEGAGMGDPAMQPRALPPGVDPKVNLPPALGAPSASPVLPPFQIPGLPTSPQPSVPTAGMPQPGIVQGGADGAPTPQVIPAQYTPPPVAAPPPEPPQVPRPGLPPAEANYLNNMVMTRQMTPQQAEAEKNKRINELWSDQKTVAREKWTQQQENYRFNRGEETKKDVWRPLTAQERDQMLPGSRPDAQLQINSRTGEVKPILSARDTKPDVSQYYQDPDVQKKVAAMSPSDRAAFNAATGSGDHKGANAILTKAQTGLTEEQQALSGDDLLKTLPFGDREIVEGLTTGRLTPTDLSKRAGNGTDFNRLIALASKVDPSYSPGPGGARRAFETKYMSGAGQGQATLLAANTAIQHMGIAHDLVAELKNGDGQITNTVKNYLKTQFGAGDVTSAHAALQLMGVEIAKTVKGAGSLGLAEEQAAQKLATTSMSDDQINKNISVLTDFMMGRVHSVEDLAKSHGISDSTVNGYISPRSRETLQRIQDNPLGGVKSGAAGQTIKIDMSGKRQ